MILEVNQSYTPPPPLDKYFGPPIEGARGVSRAPENLKLAGNWPEMAAMCGLQDYQKKNIFVVFKLIIPITMAFMGLFWACRPICLAISISGSSFQWIQWKKKANNLRERRIKNLLVLIRLHQVIPELRAIPHTIIFFSHQYNWGSHITESPILLIHQYYSILHPVASNYHLVTPDKDWYCVYLSQSKYTISNTNNNINTI